MPPHPWTKLSFREAIAYFRAKANINTDSWRDVQGIESDAVFAVAGAKGALLQDLREAVDQAIAQGTTLQAFRQTFDQVVANRGWSYQGDRDWRTNIIYQTNLRTAYGAGREAQIQQVKARRPYAMWRHGGSRDPRPEHIANDGRVWLVDERPCPLPYGYGCKCVWLTLSQRDVDAQGVELSDRLPVVEELGWSQALGLPTPEQKAALVEQVTRRLHPTLAAQVKKEVGDRGSRMGWKPLMTLAEAQAMTQGSVYAGQDFFHGTSAAAANQITRSGFSLKQATGSSYGKGFYFSNDEATARNYAVMKGGTDGAVLTSRLDVQNPKTFRFASDLYDWLAAEDLPFDESMFGAITERLKSQGYDGIEVSDLKYFVTFDPRQIATYRRA